MKLLQFRIWGGKIDYNHSMYIWASDMDTAFFGIARRIDPSVTTSQWTGKEIEPDKVLGALKRNDKKKEYPCKHCEYGTYMTVEDTWWCSRYVMYVQQVALNHSSAKCLKGVTSDTTGI